MDRRNSISPDTLYAKLGSEAAPIIIDVRRDADFAGAETLVAGAFHRSPDAVEEWRTDLPSGRQVVTYCTHGREVSQGVAAALRLMGVAANFLEGGIADWTEHGLPTRHNIGSSPSTWVTRERPKIDRIACPWLIWRFIDPNAEFIYVPKGEVLAVARQKGGNSLRHRRGGIHPRRRALLVRYYLALLRDQGSRARPSGNDRQRGRYLAARSEPSMRRPVRDFARTLRQLPGRP